MADEYIHLPVVQSDLDESEPSCSPKIYVSNEEAALLEEMRHLREQSVELKKAIRDAETEQCSRLESELEEMRKSWKSLAARREKAFIRKMIMLGHLTLTHPNQ